MTSVKSAKAEKKVRTLLATGVLLLLVGIALNLFSEGLSEEVVSRNADGYTATLDENKMRRIEFVGDRLSWLGLTLTTVGAAGWMFRCEDE